MPVATKTKPFDLDGIPSDECPFYTELGPPPPYPSWSLEEAAADDQDAYTLAELDEYFGYSSQLELRALGLESCPGGQSLKWLSRSSGGFFLVTTYTISVIAMALLHQGLMYEIELPNLLITVYSKFLTVFCMVYIIWTQYVPEFMRIVFPVNGSLLEDLENAEVTPTSREERQHTWKLFAFVLLDFLSQECWWLSAQILPLEMQQMLQAVYPLLALILTWQWVFNGQVQRMASMMSRSEKHRALKNAGLSMVSLVIIYCTINVRPEWWYCMFGVGFKAFRDVIARDIFTTTPLLSPELFLLSSSLITFSSLSACFSSMEYLTLWSTISEMQNSTYLKIFAAATCYSVTRLAGLEIWRSWDPVRGASLVVLPAFVMIALGLLGYF